MSEFECYVKAGITEDVRASWRQLVCRKLPLHAKHEGAPYCVLHYPGKDKESDFQEAISQKLAGEDNAFQAVYFPLHFPDSLVGWLSPERLNKRARFAGATFEAGASFFRTTLDYAGFTGATFKGATDFRGATFNEGVYFDHATFEEVHFSEADFEVTFKGNVSFLGANFTKAHFQNAVFEKTADFGKTVIGEGNFSEVRFENETTFSEAAFERWVSFSTATFEKRATFDDATFNGLAHFADTNFLQDVSFERTLFSDADFSKTKFEEGATFSGAILHGDGTFYRTTFNGSASFDNVTVRGYANFQDTNFRNAIFKNATFEKGVDFTHATFVPNNATDFRRATFVGELYFRETKFNGYTDFYRTNFLDAVKFIGGERNEELSQVFASEGRVSFKRARIDKPELFSFDTVLLRPNWFVGVDARKFDFTAVRWPAGLVNGSADAIDDEIIRIREKGETGSPYILLAQTCRRLSANAEENREYPLANEFHYWSMDALRKRSWRRLKGLTPNSLTKKETWRDIREHFGLITTLYWALSGYGVRAARAFWMLVAIWAAFTTLYVLVDPLEFKDFGQGIGYRWQAAVYSLLALVRLNPEPKPEEPGVFQFLVGLEGILGPLQIALLALAIRRKVMR